MKIITLERHNGITLYLNVDAISYFYPYNGFTRLKLNSSDAEGINGVTVKESPEEIIKLINYTNH